MTELYFKNIRHPIRMKLACFKLARFLKLFSEIGVRVYMANEECFDHFSSKTEKTNRIKFYI